MRLAASCLVILFLASNTAPADTLGEAGARQMRRHAARQADPPSCLDTEAVENRETMLRSLFTDNTVPIPLCYAPANGLGPTVEGKAFLQAEVDEVGNVIAVNVSRAVGDPPLPAAARDEAFHTRFFPVHRNGVATSTKFEYCIRRGTTTSLSPAP